MDLFKEAARQPSVVMCPLAEAPDLDFAGAPPVGLTAKPNQFAV